MRPNLELKSQPISKTTDGSEVKPTDEKFLFSFGYQRIMVKTVGKNTLGVIFLANCIPPPPNMGASLGTPVPLQLLEVVSKLDAQIFPRLATTWQEWVPQRLAKHNQSYNKVAWKFSHHGSIWEQKGNHVTLIGGSIATNGPFHFEKIITNGPYRITLSSKTRSKHMRNNDSFRKPYCTTSSQCETGNRFGGEEGGGGRREGYARWALCSVRSCHAGNAPSRSWGDDCVPNTRL